MGLSESLRNYRAWEFFPHESVGGSETNAGFLVEQHRNDGSDRANWLLDGSCCQVPLLRWFYGTDLS